MKIEVGKYTLYSDSMCMWITETVETVNKKTKLPTGKFDEKRIAGYSTSLTNLLRSFMEAKVGGSDAESLEELLTVLKETYEDMVAINTVTVKNDFKRIEAMSK